MPLRAAHRLPTQECIQDGGLDRPVSSKKELGLRDEVLLIQ
jgi:hypothetical protein